MTGDLLVTSSARADEVPAGYSVHDLPGRRLNGGLAEQDGGGRVAERDETVLAGHPPDPAGEPRVGQRADHALGYAAGAPGLVGDQDPAGGGRLAEQVLARQRGPAAQVQDAPAYSARRQPPARPQAHPQPVAERDDRQVGPAAVPPGPADRAVLDQTVPGGQPGQPAALAGGQQG